MTELHSLGAARIAELVRQREVSPVAVVEDCLQRIEALEAKLQAWALLD
jgi:Asp-tRNA(Asn)/Glu-tRNA(Gln) amidotransferase A subunit family amidase